MRGKVAAMITLTNYSAAMTAIGLFFLGVVMCLLIQAVLKLVDARRRLSDAKDQIYENCIEKGQIVGREGYIPCGRAGRKT